MINIKQFKCQRTGHDSTTNRARPKYEKKIETKKENARGSEERETQESQNGCKRNNLRACEGKQLPVARTKQPEEEEDTGLRPAGRGNKGI